MMHEQNDDMDGRSNEVHPRRMNESKRPRPESEIFAELETLCSSQGYIHAIAYFCQRDNMIHYSGQMTPKDMEHLFSRERLIRTETTTLIGLMLKHKISYELPAPENMQGYLDKTEELLEELHWSMSAAFWEGVDPEKIAEGTINPFASGKPMREPIFYGGESAYSFQYRDFAVRKYAEDDAWLKANKGFSIAQARDVAEAVGQIANEKGATTFHRLGSLPPDQRTFLPAHEFSCQEVAHRSGIDETQVERVLAALTVPEGESNSGFTALNEFNVANAYPLLRRNDTYILFHIYSLVEALYEAPFYWMGADKAYVDTAMRNRGRFTEEFAVDRFTTIFGKENVYANVDIMESKATAVGEIDVLVLFGNRAIVLQAKSKRLTLEARKGNDGQIKSDFQKAVQDAYDQGLDCARFLLDRRHTFLDGLGRELALPDLKQVYILCMVADHYPALSFQVRQFLKIETSSAIPPPFVLDVFTLDAMTEMLDTPLFLLSYIDRRAAYSERLMASHELTILSDHIKRNLWLTGEHDLVMLDDSISADLDLAMLARREGVNAPKTPDGILTRLKKTTVGRLIEQIESTPDPRTIELGFMLLTIGEDSAVNISRGIDKLAALARTDGKHHDIGAGFETANTGLTVHCNNDEIEVAAPRLEGHCRLRKYMQKAGTWFGICVSPADVTLRFGVNLDFPWEQSTDLDAVVRTLPQSSGLAESANRRRRKHGRNEPCHCGSGKKYKKCCGKPGT